MSPLGNGVSVIRLRVALEFAGNEGGNDDGSGGGGARLFMGELQQKMADMNTKSFMREDPVRQIVAAEYVTDVASTLLNRRISFRSAAMDSVRVPFAEEAVKEFKRVTQEERSLFQEQMSAAENGGGNSGAVVVSVILSIKGDRTSVPFRDRRGEIDRGLERIVMDSGVEGCLVATEVLWTPVANVDDFPGLVTLS